MTVRVNQVSAEFDMTGRCQVCNKPIRRRRKFTARSMRALVDRVRAYNESHPFYCKAHKSEALGGPNAAGQHEHPPVRGHAPIR